MAPANEHDTPRVRGQIVLEMLQRHQSAYLVEERGKVCCRCVRLAVGRVQDAGEEHSERLKSVRGGRRTRCGVEQRQQ